MDLLIKVRDAKYRPISELQPGLPPELEAIADKCLTRSRANRYQTAAEAEGDLRAFLKKFMPNYSRSHLGRFIRKMFATEIERELRMLEEYVMTDSPSDDVGESLMIRDADFEPPEVPFQPKPTSVSVALPASDFAGDSNVITSSESAVKQLPDVHAQNTQILDDKGRNAPNVKRVINRPHTIPRATMQQAAAKMPPSSQPIGPNARTAPPPPPPPQRRTALRGSQPTMPKPPPNAFDEELHAAPTMIIDINRVRRRR
jgi:hypothetical protein